MRLPRACRLRLHLTVRLSLSAAKVNLAHVRVHDLKHTFGRRLRAAGVSFEDRQDLLGHRSGRITTHYSTAELQNLYEAANKVCVEQHSGVALTLLRRSNTAKLVCQDQQEAEGAVL